MPPRPTSAHLNFTLQASTRYCRLRQHGTTAPATSDPRAPHGRNCCGDSVFFARASTTRRERGKDRGWRRPACGHGGHARALPPAPLNHTYAPPCAPQSHERRVWKRTKSNRTKSGEPLLYQHLRPPVPASRHLLRSPFASALESSSPLGSKVASSSAASVVAVGARMR